MRLATLLLLALAGLPVRATSPDPNDALRIDEAYRLIASVQDSVWPGGWGAVPFPILLVTKEREYLVAYPRTPPGFEEGRLAPAFALPVLERPRQFAPNLLASFPAFGPPSVVVIGQPEATRKHSTAWVLTILHERFHLFQTGDPSYYEAVAGLDLSGGDQTGMWMLDYPFPYDSASVARPFATLAHTLGRLVQHSTPAERQAFWSAYAEFIGTLAAADRRYLGFQLWQEGVARYAELRGAEVAARLYRPTAGFEALPDFASFATEAAHLRADLLGALASPDLPAQRRVAFYAFGAGMALLLDQDAPGWQTRYHEERFALERYLAPGG